MRESSGAEDEDTVETEDESGEEEAHLNISTVH